MIFLLLLVGGLLALVGWIWMILIAFSESVPWAVVIFFFGPLGLVYGYLRWDDAKAPTIFMLIGLVMYIIGRVAG